MTTKTKTDLNERIAVRAYFIWLNGATDGHEADWLRAELLERAEFLLAKGRADRRSAAAKKAAATRKAKAAAKAPAEVIAAMPRHPATRRQMIAAGRATH